jgi:hypothetical protein
MASCTLYGCDSDSDAVITVERPGPPGFGWRQARACLDHMEEVALWLVQPAEEILRRGELRAKDMEFDEEARDG